MPKVDRKAVARHEGARHLDWIAPDMHEDRTGGLRAQQRPYETQARLLHKPRLVLLHLLKKLGKFGIGCSTNRRRHPLGREIVHRPPIATRALQNGIANVADVASLEEAFAILFSGAGGYRWVTEIDAQLRQQVADT